MLLVLPSVERKKEILCAFLWEWSVSAAVEPSHLGRDKVQRCSHSGMAIATIRQKKKLQSLNDSPHTNKYDASSLS